MTHGVRVESSSGTVAERADPRVEVWLVVPERIRSRAHLRTLGAMLDSDEISAYQRLRHAQSQHSYLVAHALLRTALSRHACVPPDAWRFKRNGLGKPKVESHPQLCFSLSHAIGLVACAVSTDTDVGLDVECCDHGFDPLDLSHWVLAPAELEELAGLGLADRVERFTTLWVMKEAVAKGMGLGLSAPLATWTFSRICDEEFDLDTTGGTTGSGYSWRCRVLAPTSTHRMAVAAAVSPGQRLQLDITAADQLLQ